MSNLYLDQQKKIEYYKQQISDFYLGEGRVIEKLMLDKYLESIDSKLSIFRQNFINGGETLDIDKFNEQKSHIYADIKILYETMYELAKTRLAKIENKIICQLEELKFKEKEYKARTSLESLSVYGNTVLFKTNDLKQEYSNGKVKINLGDISIPSGSYCACMASIDNVMPSDIVFNFGDNKQVSDYFYNRELLKVSDNYVINTYDRKNEEKHISSFKINIDKDMVKKSNAYNIFVQKDNVKIKYSSEYGSIYVPKNSNIGLEVKQKARISFYVYGAEKIEFNMNDNYSYKNFEGYLINTPKQRQKIVIDVEPGFIFDLVTDGKIFADYSKCVIENDEVYSVSHFNDITDYMIEEIAYGEPVVFNDVLIIIDNADTIFFDVNYIAIKQAQISELDGEL